MQTRIYYSGIIQKATSVRHLKWHRKIGLEHNFVRNKKLERVLDIWNRIAEK